MDPEQNLSALRKKQFMVKFDLEGTSYSPLENIGSGAYGVVCSANDKRSNEQVAIKKIPSIFDQLTLIKRTYREIRILKHFKHDNIISIREILKPRDLQNFKDIYIVFDLMESDLHRIIQSKQELTDDHVRFFTYQILRGLKYIHSANVIHRDLKPSNLLVNENCTLKIGDFGLSRGIDQGPGKQKFAKTLYVATRWYRAPELMLSISDYSAAIDVWSVGCILAELLNKKPLFPGINFLHQLKLIIDVLGTPPKEFLKLSKSNAVPKFIEALGDQQPKPLKEIYPQAPRKAVDLLGKMLVFNPRKRITVEQALRHPYLNKYHDPDDEPICTPAFNFDFEKKQLTAEELKKELITEIMEFHQSELHMPIFSAGGEIASCSSTCSEPGVRMGAACTSFADVTLTTLADLIPENSSPEDIEMLSASLGKVLSPIQVNALAQEVKLEDFEMKSAKVEPKVEVKAEPEPSDSKAVIKAALLRAIERKKLLAEAKSKVQTASQNPKSKEDGRRRKREKVLQAKKKRNNSESKDDKLTLSEEDKRLLEKWETMHGQTQRNPQAETHNQRILPKIAAQTTAGQSVLVQPVFLSTQASSLQNQNQMVINVVQIPVATLPTVTNTTHTQGAADVNTDYTKTVVSTERISMDSVCAESTKRDSTNLTSAESSSTSRSSFHSDHTYYKPLGEDESKTGDNQLKTDAWLNALTQKVSRSHIDDLTLDGTPKGNGSGYGLGDDFEMLLNEAAGGSQAGGGDRPAQSAALSATLLSDWLDVTKNMDPSEFETLQQELDLGSPLSFEDF